jgi:predicted CopG family antitoxin
MQNITTIQITKETRKKLKDIGKKGETYNDIILRLLEECH